MVAAVDRALQILDCFDGEQEQLALKDIAAWNLQGSQVVLSGQGGSPVAQLSPSGSGRTRRAPDA